MTRLFLLAALALVLPQIAVAQPPPPETPVFDLHVHIWRGAQSIREYEAQLRETNQGVTRFGGLHMAVGPGQLDEMRAKNDELLALARTHPSLLPIPSVHPYDGAAAIAELRRLAAAGVRAIKLHPHTQQFDVTDPRVLTLVQEAGTLGVVVMMDNANIIPGDSENLFNLAVRAPRTKFLFAHLGGMNFRFWNIIPLARTTRDFWPDNLWFDISALVVLAADSPIEAELVWTMRNVGIDRLLLGSDYPQLSLAQSVQALDRLDLTPEERAQIRYGNAERLLLGARE
ncbi:amidohydrolase family protein [Sphingosinicella sp. LHD-64]|uniref:amidohydrolase family protein n=1 Tax=Sphingosinicella sp. LHD-64 TaxID=3072139 RepID=UPI0028104A91|nr:amidohydrolase family protein [Sphingosinicella sp. LHD-64]MDQ8758300.1 amidohydrolase family protein [Sphingosinicella sp. LHD-64]